MRSEELEQIIKLITRGETHSAEALFNKPGGRKYLENIVLIVITNLPSSDDEKEELFFAFVKVLNKLEKRIKRQKEGEKILEQVYN